MVGVQEGDISERDGYGASHVHTPGSQGRRERGERRGGEKTIQYKKRCDMIKVECLRYGTIRYDTIRYERIKYRTIRHDTVRYYTTRYDTIRNDGERAEQKGRYCIVVRAMRCDAVSLTL